MQPTLSYLRQWWLVIGAVAVVSLLTFACHSTTELETQKHAIINGDKDLSQPAIGSILTKGGLSFCTGTLITRQLVLTAAHCVDNVIKVGLHRAQFGIDTAGPNGSINRSYHVIDQVARHPQHQAGSNYDVGVLILKQKVQQIEPIPANRAPMDPKWIGTDAKLVGYGLIQTQPTRIAADQKHSALIPISDISQGSFLNYDANPDESKRKNNCSGDSGGPVLYTIGGKPHVIGVISVVFQTKTPQGLGLCDGSTGSARVDTYMNFLLPYLRRYSDGGEACQKNEDCSDCDVCGQDKICKPEPITKATSHCGPCKSDADCQGGLCIHTAMGSRCFQACTPKSCCPSDSYCGVPQGRRDGKQACIPKDLSCPAPACKADADCGSGERCDPQSNKCLPQLPARLPTLCQPCLSSTDCKVGLCVGLVGKGHCSQPCSDGALCPTGFTCKQLYPGLPAQCVPTTKNCWIPCQADADCPKQGAKALSCRQGRCISADHGDVMDPCDDTTPCKTGLSCAETIDGKRCLVVCGIKPGYGGTTCTETSTCLDGTRCYKNSAQQNCISSCKTTAECTAKGGGSCTSLGNCLCRSDQQCASTHQCNFFTFSSSGTPYGACAPKAQNQDCAGTSSCASFGNNKSYCVPKQPGGRAIGAACDPLHACQAGLTCLEVSGGSVCVEDCTQSKQCTLGGSCTPWEGKSYCFCKDKDCPQGRFCQLRLASQGVCTLGEAGTCIDQRDCPQGLPCKEGKCIDPRPAPEPPPEPTSETSSESSSEDAGTTPPPEARPDTADADVANPPKKGCGCEQRTSQHSQQIPLSWLCLLCLGFVWRGTKR